MSKMIQIRNVPEELHRQVKVRAAKLGMTMSDYLLGEVKKLMARPTRQEVLERIAGREPVELEVPAAELVRAEREAR